MPGSPSSLIQMAVSGSVRKRRRVIETPPSISGDEETTGRPDVGELQRHPRYWCDDGNVVITAGNVAFRVHTSFLGRESDTLKDMLSPPAPGPLMKGEAGVEEMDGCRVVHALGDTAEDWANLLFVLYESKRFLISDEKPSNSLLISLARLGTKYQMSEIKQIALSKLHEFFPPTLSEWDVALRLEYLDSAIAIVGIARACGSTTLLCGALFSCCVLSHFEKETVLNGSRQDDGHIDQLSPEDVKRCLEGHDELVAMIKTRMMFLFDLKCSDRCKSRGACQFIFPQLLRGAMERDCFHSIVVVDDKTKVALMLGSVKLCQECSGVIAGKLYNVRHSIWCEMPTVLGINADGWEVWHD